MNRIVTVKINNKTWEVRRLPEENMKHYGQTALGFTWDSHKAIDILETLTKDEILLVITHEVCHALFLNQGRRYQTKFDLEEVCEIIAWNIDEISRISNEIFEKFTKRNKK